MHSCEAQVQLGTRCKSAVSFTAWLSYSHGKIIWYQLYGRMGGPQGRVRDFAEWSNFLPFPANEPWFLNCPACRPVTILTELSWLRSSVHYTITKFVPLSVRGEGGNSSFWKATRLSLGDQGIKVLFAAGSQMLSSSPKATRHDMGSDKPFIQ